MTLNEALLLAEERKYTDLVGIERLVGRIEDNLILKYDVKVNREDIKAYVKKQESENPAWLQRARKRAAEIGMGGGAKSKGRAYLITVVTSMSVRHFLKQVRPNVKYSGLIKGSNWKNARKIKNDFGE